MRTKRVGDAPRTKSKEQALNSLMALCARAEKSSGDARRLMSRWGVEANDQEQVLGELLREKFIDDERYASAFIREKININGWGEYKIRRQLSTKGVSKEIIDESMELLNRDAMGERLKELVERRSRSVKYTTKYQLRDKLIRYGASLGYGFSTVSEVVSEVISNIKDDEECYDF